MWDNEHKLNQIHIKIFINKKTIITKCANIMHGYRNTTIKHTSRTIQRALNAHQKVSVHIKYFLGRIKKLKKRFFLTNSSQVEQGGAKKRGFKGVKPKTRSTNLRIRPKNPIDPDHLDHFSSTMKRINY